MAVAISPGPNNFTSEFVQFRQRSLGRKRLGYQQPCKLLASVYIPFHRGVRVSDAIHSWSKPRGNRLFDQSATDVMIRSFRRWICQFNYATHHCVQSWTSPRRTAASNRRYSLGIWLWYLSFVAFCVLSASRGVLPRGFRELSLQSPSRLFCELAWASTQIEKSASSGIPTRLSTEGLGRYN